MRCLDDPILLKLWYLWDFIWFNQFHKHLHTTLSMLSEKFNKNSSYDHLFSFSLDFFIYFSSIVQFFYPLLYELVQYPNMCIIYMSSSLLHHTCFPYSSMQCSIQGTVVTKHQFTINFLSRIIHLYFHFPSILITVSVWLLQTLF